MRSSESQARGVYVEAGQPESDRRNGAGLRASGYRDATAAHLPDFGVRFTTRNSSGAARLNKRLMLHQLGMLLITASFWELWAGG